MSITEVSNLLRILLQKYFSGANVIFAQQSRAAQYSNPLIVLQPGSVNIQNMQNLCTTNGKIINEFTNRARYTIDLFTRGKEILGSEKPLVVARENTAVEDLGSFAQFLDSDYVIKICHNNDMSILIDGDVQDMTGVVNDTNFEFRSRLNLIVTFCELKSGSSLTYSEKGLSFPVFEYDERSETVVPVIDPETGLQKKTNSRPKVDESVTGEYQSVENAEFENADDSNDVTKIHSGSIGKDVTKDDGFFESVIIKHKTI